MVIVIRQNPDRGQLDRLMNWLSGQGVDPRVVEGASQTILGLVGDTSLVDIDLIRSLDIVESVKRISEPYKSANRKFHPESSVVDVSGARIGGDGCILIAGPCSVESEEQIIGIARAVKASGAQMLRGGAFKPRTSPYAFQGMGADGIELLLLAKKETGLPIVSELMDYSQLPLFEEVDMIQIGARNMQNFGLLKELGKLDKPILLKRGLSNTLEELLMSAEYILAGGNSQVVLCERGIRTFETSTRNTLDLSAVPMLREMTHLPVVVDPSHGTGIARLVKPMALAAAACGADGIMVEVHNDPANAKCDGPQSLKPDEFEELAHGVGAVMEALYPGAEKC